MGETERSKFDTVARQYAAARPDYPAELYDTIGAALSKPWSDTAVLDVAAGTGIATRQLAERAATVLAVELSGAMLAELLASSPGIPAVQGSGNALPVRDASVDLITYAQAFHWIDPARAVPEVLRVLRPDGMLALWWNRTDRSSEWEAAQEQRVAAVSELWRHSSASGAENVTFTANHGLRVLSHEFQWLREVTIEDHLLNLISKSYIAALPERDAFIENERRILLEQFPSGRLVERFSTKLSLAKR
jgi:ubiquinone/menaquinone biosynthesis C-methylase UbiE